MSITRSHKRLKKEAETHEIKKDETQEDEAKTELLETEENEDFEERTKRKRKPAKTKAERGMVSPSSYQKKSPPVKKVGEKPASPKKSLVLGKPTRKLKSQYKELTGRDYYPGNKLTPSVLQNKLMVASVSVIHSQGLYALSRINSGVNLIVYTGKRKALTSGKSEKLLEDKKEENHYKVALEAADKDEKTIIIDAKEKGSGAETINHSETPNAVIQAYKDKKSVMIRTLETIRPEEQVVVDYGFGYPFPEGGLIANQPHHNWRSYHEQYHLARSDYIDLADEKEVPPSLRTDIRFLLGTPLSKIIVIPRHLLDGTTLTRSNANHIIYAGKKDESTDEIKIDDKQLELNSLMIACYQLNTVRMRILIENGAESRRHTMDFRTILDFIRLSNKSLDEKRLFMREVIHLGKNRPYPVDPMIANGDNSFYHQCIRNPLDTPLLNELHEGFDFDLDGFKKSPLTLAFELRNFSALAILLNSCCARSENISPEFKKDLGEKIYQQLQSMDEKDWKLLKATEEWSALPANFNKAASLNMFVNQLGYTPLRKKILPSTSSSSSSSKYLDGELAPKGTSSLFSSGGRNKSSTSSSSLSMCLRSRSGNSS